MTHALKSWIKFKERTNVGFAREVGIAENTLYCWFKHSKNISDKNKNIIFRVTNGDVTPNILLGIKKGYWETKDNQDTEK